MVIGVDCDGVLTDLSLYIREYGRQWFGREPDNDAGYSVREVFSCTEKEEFRFGLKYFFWYCRKWPPREDAQKVLSRLTDKGHTLYGISARKFITMKTPLGIYSKSLFKNG